MPQLFYFDYKTQLATENSTDEERHWNTYHGTEVWTLLSISNVLLLIFLQMVFVALCRTKSLPVMARFLGSASVACSSVIMLLCIIRKFLSWRFSLIAIGLIVAVRDVSLVNSAIICIERLIVFRWPFFYRLHMLHTRVKFLIAFVWFLTFVVVCGILLTTCFTEIHGKYFLKLHSCFQKCFTVINVTLFQILLILTLVSSISIIRLVRRKAREYVLPNKIKQYKLTLFMLTSVANFVAGTIAIIFITSMAVDTVSMHLLFECLTIVNGILDTIMYILWFRECRLELLKLLMCLRPNLREKMEKERKKIFIYTTSFSPATDGTGKTAHM